MNSDDDDEEAMADQAMMRSMEEQKRIERREQAKKEAEEKERQEREKAEQERIEREKAEKAWQQTVSALEAQLEATQTANREQITALEAKLEGKDRVLSYLRQRDSEFIDFKKTSAASRKELNEELKGLRTENKQMKQDATALQKEMKKEKKIKEIALKALTEIVTRDNAHQII